jgi:hypothetical protein|tara:strand:- start:1251 stop:1682 length:432 start_codon:yes stop_codon:yes gene_type:complete
MDNIVLDFLKQCNIKLDDANQLEGLMLPRNMLLSDSVYNSIKPAIIDLKKKFSSSSLTSLQKKAGKEQKWPLLNLVRQILKACNYQMKPIRKSAGYTKDGKKKYCRYFLIAKYKKIAKHIGISNNVVDVSDNIVDISINMITN